MGPPLTDVGYRRNASFLRQTLLDPAATIPFGFVYVDLVTRDGKKISGGNCPRSSTRKGTFISA